VRREWRGGRDLEVEKRRVGRESLLGSGRREYNSCAISADSRREVFWSLVPRIIEGLRRGWQGMQRAERLSHADRQMMPWLFSCGTDRELGEALVEKWADTRATAAQTGKELIVIPCSLRFSLAAVDGVWDWPLLDLRKECIETIRRVVDGRV
jgi:hypothetical protein